MQLGVADHPRINRAFGVDIHRRTAGLVQRQRIGVIIYIHKPAGLELFEVVQTVGLPAFLLSSAETGKEKRCEDADDGNHHQKFDEREAAAMSRVSLSEKANSHCFERLCIHTQDKVSQFAEICHVVWAKIWRNSRTDVPKERLKIAQRFLFIAGTPPKTKRVPP